MLNKLHIFRMLPVCLKLTCYRFCTLVKKSTLLHSDFVAYGVRSIGRAVHSLCACERIKIGASNSNRFLNPAQWNHSLLPTQFSAQDTAQQATCCCDVFSHLFCSMFIINPGYQGRFYYETLAVGNVFSKSHKRCRKPQLWCWQLILILCVVEHKKYNLEDFISSGFIHTG